MEEFKSFLQDTAGRHLFNFWMDCEMFKDTMEDFDDGEYLAYRNRLFRWGINWTVFAMWTEEKLKKIGIDPKLSPGRF